MFPLSYFLGLVCVVTWSTLVVAGPCDYKSLPYLGGDGFALVPGPDGKFFNTFHHTSPAYINYLDFVSGTIVHQNIDMSPAGYTTSTGNNLHGIQVVQNRYYLYPVSVLQSGSFKGWGVGCFDIAQVQLCSANGGYTAMSTGSSSLGSTYFTGIYGLVPNGTWLFSVDQDNMLYCYDSINLGKCTGWTAYSLTTANFPSTTPTGDSQYSIDMLPGTSRLYVMKNTGSGATYVRCIDLTRWSSGASNDLSCQGFAQPSTLDMTYNRGSYLYELHFRQVFPSGQWLVCTNSIAGPCGCVDAYTGAAISDHNTAGTYNGVPAALYSLGEQINSAWTSTGGLTGKYRVGNRTYFSGLNRNGVICWDDSTNAFCLNSTGQSFSHNSSYSGLLYSGAETRDYEVSYDPLSGCFFSMGDAAIPWNFDADGNVPCQASGIYTTLLVADYAEIPVSGTANLNVTANDLPSGNINQASVAYVTAPPSASTQSFTNTKDSYGNVIFTFVPKSGVCGNVSFTYSACSNANFPKVGQTTATVHVNCPPTAVAKTIYYYPNTPTLFIATVNDTDPDLPNDFITVASASTPSHGTTSISSNLLGITYTPSTNSYATDSFTYIAQDKFSQKSNAATITAIPIIPFISIKNNGGTTVSNGGSQTFTSNVGSTTTTTDTITNSGTSPLTITGITLPNGYTTTLSTPITIQPGQTVNLPINFSPQEGGVSSGTITIYSNDPQNPVFTINTQNNAIGPSITVSANSNYLNNGQTLTLSGTPGSTITQNVVVGNNGTAALSITSNPVSGSGYSVSGGSTSVAASASTTFTVSLQKTNPGSYPGNFTINSNDGINPSFVVYFTASVVGPQIVLSENGQTITNGGTASTSGTTGTPINQTITITNNGNQNLDITGVSTSGSGYTVVSGPPSGTVLAPGQSTTVVVQYSGSNTTGTYNGGLTVTSNDTVNPTYTTSLSTTVQSSSVSVTNNGNPVSNGGTVTFPEAPVNSSSSQNIVFTNSGNSPLTITGVNIPPGYYVSGGNVSTSGTTVVQPGQTVVLTVSQNTSSPGDNNGTITFNTNDPKNPNYSIQVNGATGQGTISISGSGSSGSNSAFGNGKNGLSLPPIQQGSINTTAFTITNSNPSQSLVIYPTSVFPSGFYPVTSIPSSGLVIPAGSSLTFTVGINTNNPGLINQTILFQNSDPNNATFAVTTSVFIYYWNFTAPAAPNGTTTWKMYANSTLSWATNLATHSLNLYLVTTSSGSLKTLTTGRSSATPFYYSPSGLNLGSYYIRATLIVSTPGFTTLNGKIIYSSTFTLAYS